MDIFDYLEDDNSRITQRLADTAKNYSEWTRDRIFEEVKKAFTSIKTHFSQDSLLENNLKNNKSIKTILTEVNKYREAITSDVELIVEIHVDEPGFEQALESIADKFSQYAQYCKEIFYPAMKQNLSKEELKHVHQQIEQKILS